MFKSNLMKSSGFTFKELNFKGFLIEHDMFLSITKIKVGYEINLFKRNEIYLLKYHNHEDIYTFLYLYEEMIRKITKNIDYYVSNEKFDLLFDIELDKFLSHGGLRLKESEKVILSRVVGSYREHLIDLLNLYGMKVEDVASFYNTRTKKDIVFRTFVLLKI